MRNLWRGVGLCVGLTGFGVMALGAGALRGAPTCEDAAPAQAMVSPLELSKLGEALVQKEAEMAQLRAELASLDERALYEEALALGVVDAVKASRLPDRQQRRVAVAIVREARRNGLDPLLVVAVIRVESSFNNYAVSPVGAMGLMQVMPATGKWLAERRGRALGRTTNLFDSELNIELGAWYLAEMIEQFGTVDKALVAYNAGPGGAKKILNARAEVRTRFLAGYPAKVMGEHRKLQKAAEARMAVQAERQEPDRRG
jgi:soluble lytic murein transglycosylase